MATISAALEVQRKLDGSATLPVPPPGGGVVVVPTGTSAQVWLRPLKSVYCVTSPPSAVDAPATSSALPELRLMKRTALLSVPTSCHCWLLPSWSVYWLTAAPSAVEKFHTSTTLPECLFFSR
ncbi:hypothetical protein ASC98_25875 [Rhizobacter sp. Root1238]|nr:hypothetical protein ASC88_24590 [Rhizobacter sp. Root29]KQW06873.1 hypothetical protein ASC98_25875 [Rhizobacter sp. Root1238]